MQNIKEALTDHISSVRTQMSKDGVNALVVTSPVNLLYLTGSLFEGYVYLPLTGDPHIFVRRPNFFNGDCVYIKNIAQIYDMLAERGVSVPSETALEEDDISAGEWLKLKEVLKLDSPMHGSHILKAARMVKSPYEIDMIRASGKKHVEFISGVHKLFRPGMTDIDFAAKVECRAREMGHLSMFRSFGFRVEAAYGCILSGDNAAAASPYDFSMGGRGVDASFPGGACGDIIEKGHAVLVDISGSFGPYLTDMTRIFSYGKVSDQALRAHAASTEILETLESLGKPGTACSELYNAAGAIVAKYGLEDCYMGKTQKAKFVGHGLGLQMNEGPVLAAKSRDVLAENNIIALEPKFVIDGVGAVGSEDTYLVTPNGLECLTACDRAIREFEF